MEFVIRVRRADREVEVRGTEEFCREVSADLLGEYLAADDGEDLEATDALRGKGTITSGASGVFAAGNYTFRDMLNTMPNATAAERVVMAGYFLLKVEGEEVFDANTVAELYTRVYERQPNFSREFEKAARGGWLMKSGVADGRRIQFRLTHRGIQMVESRFNQAETL